MTWRDGTLEDLVFFQRGFDITKDQQKPGEVPVVSSSGINSYHAEATARGPGVVIGRKGSLGTVHFVDGDYWPHDTTLWSKDLRGNSAKFVYYFLKTLGLERYDVGNSNPTLNRNHIHKLPIRFPDRGTQGRIELLLSVYDDLISNNKRRIELLEQSVRLLYREWFVRLKYPGHEHDKIVGGVPEGWNYLPVGDLLTLQRGFDLPVQDRKSGPVPVYASTGITGYHDVAKVIGPGLVTGRSGSLGQVLYVSKDYWPLNTTLWVKEFKRVGVLYAKYLLENLSLEKFNGGAAVPTLNRNDVHRIKVLCPPEPLHNQFEAIVAPVFDQIECLQIYNAKLAKARDLLLPRLMDRRISV